MRAEALKGHLDDLILATLQGGPARGYTIAQTLRAQRGEFDLPEGTLYPALQRLERAGSVDAEWRQTENSRRARIYRITRAGKKQLELQTADWTRRATAIARLLKAES